MSNISEEKLEKIAEFLKALAHPIRLRIILALMKDNEICVKLLSELLETTQPNISQHLSTLKKVGIIKYSKKGMLNCYKISNEKIKKLIELILSEIE